MKLLHLVIGVGAVAVLASCAKGFDAPSSYEEIQKESYKSSFEKKYGTISPNQKWDFSTYEFRLGTTRGASAINTEIMEKGIDFGDVSKLKLKEVKFPRNPEWDYVEIEGGVEKNAAIFNAIKKALPEQKAHTGRPAVLVAPSNEFYIYPLFSGGNIRYDLKVKVGDNDPVTVFKKDYKNFQTINGMKKANGEIALQRVAGANLFRSEVTEIFEHEGSLQFVADNGVIYQVKDGQVTVRKEVDKELLKIGMLDVLDVEALEKGESDVVKNDTIQVLTLSKDLKAVLMKNSGIHITDGKNHTLYTLTDANGLCSNNIAYAAYDGRGHLWGATSKGIFVVGIPSAFSHYTPHEGLQGTVLSIESLNGSIYAGTDDGLYRQEGHCFVKVPGVAHACWQLVRSGNGLLAASADGIYRVYADGRVRQLTNSNAMALLEDGSHLYSGETNGIFLMQADGQNRQKVCDMDNVKKLVKDKEGTIWAQSLYGTIWYKKAADSSFHHYEGKGKKETMLTSAIVTSENANVLMLESDEIVRQSQRLTLLKEK